MPPAGFLWFEIDITALCAFLKPRNISVLLNASIGCKIQELVLRRNTNSWVGREYLKTSLQCYGESYQLRELCI